MNYEFNIGDRVVFIPKDKMPQLTTVINKRKLTEDCYIYYVKDDNGYSHYVGCGDIILRADSYGECLRSYLGVHERKLELLKEQLDNEKAVINEVNKILNKTENKYPKEIVW